MEKDDIKCTEVLVKDIDCFYNKKYRIKKMPNRINVYVKNVLPGAVIKIVRMTKWHIKENQFLNLLNLGIQLTKGS